MSDAPRWPGSDGGPGLDFSPHRTRDESAEPVESPASPSQDDTQVHEPVKAPGAEVDEPERAVEAGPADDVHADAAGDEHQGVPPRVAERAARTAREWASMPVGPTFRGVEPGPSSPIAPGAPGTGAAAATAAAGVAGATAARSHGSPVPVRRAAPGEEDVDPLPLDEVYEKKQAQPSRAARSVARPRRTRKARLRLARLDPWSVMKTTLLFAIAFGIMFVVATFAIWSLLASIGTLEYVNTLLNQLFGDQNTEFDVTQILTVRRILGFSAIVSAINVVIITALATLFAFLYNLAATVMGGLELTLAED